MLLTLEEVLIVVILALYEVVLHGRHFIRSTVEDSHTQYQVRAGIIRDISYAGRQAHGAREVFVQEEHRCEHTTKEMVQTPLCHHTRYGIHSTRPGP